MVLFHEPGTLGIGKLSRPLRRREGHRDEGEASLLQARADLAVGLRGLAPPSIFKEKGGGRRREGDAEKKLAPSRVP